MILYDKTMVLYGKRGILLYDPMVPYGKLMSSYGKPIVSYDNLWYRMVNQ